MRFHPYRPTQAVVLAFLSATQAACGEDAATPSAPAVESSPTVAAFTVAPAFRSVSAGTDHTCGITTFTRAYCWGGNSSGQLGTFDRMKRLTATPVKGHLPLDTVVAGNGNSCGRTTDGVTYCWGQNLPTGTTTQPSLLDSTRHFVHIAAELNHMCGLTEGGQAWCRGANGSGQLGDGTTTDRPVLVKVLGGHAFRQISTSTHHTCAVTTDDRAFCWGDNAFGQVGNGGTSFAPVVKPTAVLGGVRFQAVSAGGTFTCGLATDDRAYCWGWNNEGQLGDETLTDHPTPTLVHGAHRWLAIEAGDNHACAVDQGGKGFCWGRGGEGQLGIGVLDPIDHGQKPRAVVGGLTWRQISAGGLHTCGVTTSDVPYCWGYNLRGQLGEGTVTTRTKPTKVVGPS